MLSSIVTLSPVVFPAFTGERLYMIPFTREAGLPEEFQRWQPTVDSMLEGLAFTGKCFLTVDQGTVTAGNSQRRGGVHVDGWWDEASCTHKSPRPPGHRIDRIGHGLPVYEGLALASNVAHSTAAYLGEYSGVPSAGGDFSHLDLSTLTRVELEPNRAYIGGALEMLHESLPLAQDCERTFVRLNVQGWVAS